jgi:hypothetical protein
MLTASTPIPTSLRGKIRALVKAHAGWHEFLTEKDIISASARNADLLEFALRHPQLTNWIEQLLLGTNTDEVAVEVTAEATAEPSAETSTGAVLMLAKHVEALLAAYAARKAPKLRVRIKAGTATV